MSNLPATAKLTRTLAVALAVVVLLSAAAPAMAIPKAEGEVAIEQSAPATAAPGDTITVTVTINATDLNGPAVDATLPSGWTIQSQSVVDGPSATYKESTEQWLWLAAPATQEYTIEYDLLVPASAAEGDYTLAAEGSGIIPDTGSRVTDVAQSTITVEQNDPPSADAGADQTVDEGTSVSLDATGSSDPDGDSLTYSWTQTGGTAVSLNGASTATPTFNAPAQVSTDETLTFAVSVSDGTATTTDTVNVTVQPVNDPPTADAGTDQTVTSGDSVQLSGSGSDPDGDSLSYSWTQTGGTTVSLSGASTAAPSFTAPDVGSATTLTFELTVSDGSLSATDTVAITVQPSNDPPVADAGSDQSVAAGDPVTLDATGSSDPDGDSLTYQWTQTSGTAVSLQDAGTATPTFTAPNADATLTFEVTVSDGIASDTDTVTVTVDAANQAPTADFDHTPSSPATGETVTFDAGASSDPDGSIVSYEWTVETAGGTDVVLLDSDFEEATLGDAGWSHDDISGTAEAGVSEATANSPTQSAYHSSGAGALVSPTLDTSGAQSVALTYWVQKGDDAFSENPDPGAGEDLIVEYHADDGSWIEIDRIEDSVADGATYDGEMTLADANALHAGFELRFRQEGASAEDYWHVDDVTVTATTSGSGTTTMSGSVVTHAFAAPGEYDATLVVTDDEGATDTTTQTVTVSDDGDLTIPEAVAGEDGLISTQELQQAIAWWVDDTEVPGTSGQTIDTATLQQLIDMWVEDDPVGAAGGTGL